MLSLIVIIALVWGLYFPVYSFELINFDDNVYISENPIVLSGLSWDGVRWAFSNRQGGNWHPLSWLSHMLDVSLFGVNPGVFHLENVLFHSLSACLLFLILRQFAELKSIALFAALLWACHPLRLESVAWVTERKDVLSVLFGLCSVLLYSKCSYSGPAKKRIYYYSSLGCFTLSLLSKPTLVTLPLMLCIFDIFRSRRAVNALVDSLEEAHDSSFSVRAIIHRAIPFFVASALTCLCAIYAQSAGGGLRTFADNGLSDRFNLIFTGYLVYLGKLFFPFQLSIFYPRLALPTALGVGCCVALVFLSISVWRIRAQWPALYLGWVWFIVTLLPMSGVVTIGGQFVADRWTYVPHIGLVVALAHTLRARLSQYSNAILALLVIALSSITFYELPSWKSSISIFRRALDSNSENFLAHNNLGAALAAAGEKDEALRHYKEAVRLNPSYPEALNNLGTAWGERGRFRDALEQFESALRIRPEFEIAQRNRAQALKDLGN